MVSQAKFKHDNIANYCHNHLKIEIKAPTRPDGQMSNIETTTFVVVLIEEVFVKKGTHL